MGCKKENGLIDIAKVYCALMIVFIHAYDIQTYANWDAILYGITNQAVPFFFLISGFFLGRRRKQNQINPKSMKDKCCHYLALYSVWCLICIFNIVSAYSDENPITMIALILRRILFAGYSVYWYLIVLAESFFVIYFVLKMNTKRMIRFAVCGLLLGICYDLSISWGIFGCLNRVFYLVFSWDNNVIMKGIPFVVFGILISEHKNIVSSYMWVILYLITNVLGVLIYHWGIHGISAFIFPIEAILLLLICTSDVSFKLSDKVGRMLRGFSSCLYFLNPIIIWNIIEQIWGAHSPLTLKFYGTILISMGVFIIAWLLNIKPLNWLLSIKH